MKAVYKAFATKEDAKTLARGGSKSFEKPTPYTRDDFLTPGQVAKKFKIATKTAEDLMKKLRKNRMAFIANGHRGQIIVDLRKHGSVYLNPLAIDAFKQYLDQENQKAKQ